MTLRIPFSSVFFGFCSPRFSKKYEKPVGYSEDIRQSLKKFIELISQGNVEELSLRRRLTKIGINIIEFEARVGFSELEKIPHVLGRLDILENVEVRFERDGVRFVARD